MHEILFYFLNHYGNIGKSFDSGVRFMNKKMIGCLSIAGLLTLACTLGFAANNTNLLDNRTANAAVPTYSVTFNKDTWNVDRSENSVVTSAGTKLELVFHQINDRDLKFEDVDGICSIMGNDSAYVSFNFPFQRINSFKIDYEYEDGNSSTANSKPLNLSYGTTLGSFTSNGGTATSGVERSVTYWNANIYWNIHWNVNIASTDRITIKSITINYACSNSN